MSNLTINRYKAMAAYAKIDARGRELLEYLFGKVIFVKQNVTERIKTFEDAREALGDEHPLVKEYWGVVNVDLDITQGLIAYLKLRIITAALNEGWEPQFKKYEWRYFPRLEFFTQEEINEMGASEKARVVKISHAGYNSSAFIGIAFAQVIASSKFSSYQSDARLAFKNQKLAEYAGRQFTELYAEFMFSQKM